MVGTTAFYAGLLALVFIALSRRVIAYRRGKRIAIGAEGDDGLLRRVRAQANFAEYVPLALVLMGFAEIQGLAAAMVHGLGVALLAGRLVHAFGLSRTPEDFRLREGMVLTFAVLAIGAATNLFLAARAWLAGA